MFSPPKYKKCLDMQLQVCSILSPVSAYGNLMLKCSWSVCYIHTTVGSCCMTVLMLH